MMPEMQEAQMLTVSDVERLQAQFPDYRMEIVDGEVRIMSPSGYESDEVASRISGKLLHWVDERKLGRVTGSSAGFALVNTRAPDVSFIRAERLPRAPRGFAVIPPDLMVEVKSPTDRLIDLRDKIDEFLRQGTTVGILADPETRTLEIRRLGQEPTVLNDGDDLTVEDVVPGWSVAVSDLWSPIFE
jgi:Uma2 family endonuclease